MLCYINDLPTLRKAASKQIRIMGKHSSPLQMSSEDRLKLETWVRAKTSPQRVVFRAQICLLAADGCPAGEIAQRMHTSRPTVLLWKKRFDELGPCGLVKDAPRGPSPRRLDDATTRAILETTRNAAPTGGDHWTTRALAKVLGVSNATVARVWKAHGITPKKKKARKPPGPGPAAQRSSTLLGTYVSLPLKGFVVSIEHGPTKANRHGRTTEVGQGRHRLQVGARERTCTSCAFSALELLGLSAAGTRGANQIMGDFVRFLDRIEADAPDGKELHVILDYGGALPNPKKGRGLGTYGRLHLHAYPLGPLSVSSISAAATASAGAWLDLDSAGALSGLISAMSEFISAEGPAGRPFVWTMPKDSAPEKVNVCKVVLATIQRAGSLIINRMGLDLSPRPVVPAEDEVAAKWVEKIESWVAAAAFAEEGDHKTDLEAAAGPIPGNLGPVELFPFLNKVFAAAAFAEADCHEMAAAILGDANRWASFMEAVGPSRTRVWTGVAQFEDSFAEAVGLSAVRCRVLTLSV